MEINTKFQPSESVYIIYRGKIKEGKVDNIRIDGNIYEDPWEKGKIIKKFNTSYRIEVAFGEVATYESYDESEIYHTKEELLVSLASEDEVC